MSRVFQSVCPQPFPLYWCPLFSGPLVLQLGFADPLVFFGDVGQAVCAFFCFFFCWLFPKFFFFPSHVPLWGSLLNKLRRRGEPRGPLFFSFFRVQTPSAIVWKPCCNVFSCVGTRDLLLILIAPFGPFQVGYTTLLGFRLPRMIPLPFSCPPPSPVPLFFFFHC